MKRFSRAYSRFFCGAAAVLTLAYAAAGATATYEYPVQDPLAATVVGTPEAVRAELPRSVPIEQRALDPLVARRIPSVLGYAQPLRYNLAVQDGPAPLVFLVAGTGAGAGSADNRLLMKVLYQAGFHVAALPSPTTVRFLLNAAAHPVPGRMPADVAALYNMMQAIRARLDHRIEITGYHLAGYSLGATQAAFVAWEDERQGEFGFQRVLLINPAVSVYTSVRRLDALLLEGLPNGIADLPVFLGRIMGQLRYVYGTGAPLRFNRDMLFRAYLKANPDHQELAGLVGLAFRLSLANMAFAADLLNDAGVIVPRGRELGVGDSLERYLVRSMRLSFDDYLDQLLLPSYQGAGQDRPTRAEVIAESDMTTIENYLAGAEHIGVISNRDDPILGDGELAFLRRTFGRRAHIYPRGGHLGNLAQYQTVRDIQAFFRP